MTRRIKKQSNPERWLVSYADMMTLLLGLFIVLYAVKQEGVSETVIQESFAAVANKKVSQDFADYVDLPGKIRDRLANLVDSGVVEISSEASHIEIVVFNKDVFALGSAKLSENSFPILDEIADSILMVDNRVLVEGYTDNLKIEGGVYPSNWELSSARASSVVRYFEFSGVQSSRMRVVGFGEQNPIADNSTDAGRSRNRRVVVKIYREFSGGKKKE